MAMFDGYVIAFAKRDRKSTRLNSSHLVISYAVFCLKKKNTDRPASITSSWASFWRLSRLPRVGLRPSRRRVLRAGAPAGARRISVVFFFFFKGSGHPQNLPFSPPRRFPD